MTRRKEQNSPMSMPSNTSGYSSDVPSVVPDSPLFAEGSENISLKISESS